jgi:hypothetical protein
VFVRQGHYARAPQARAVQPAPDRVIECIADVIGHDLSDFQLSDFEEPS